MFPDGCITIILPVSAMLIDTNVIMINSHISLIINEVNFLSSQQIRNAVVMLVLFEFNMIIESDPRIVLKLFERVAVEGKRLEMAAFYFFKKSLS